MLTSVAAGSAIDVAMVRRTPSPSTLVECLANEAPGFRDSTEVSIQALKNCMGQVQKREETSTEGADVDASSYIIDGGKANVKVT